MEPVILPNGVQCVQYLCTPEESLAIALFFRGTQIDTATHPVFQSAPPQNETYYRVRGRKNLSAMIVESDDCPTRILVPFDFTSYCAYFSESSDVPCAHDQIFPRIMEEIYGCIDAFDIAAIRVEAPPPAEPLYASATEPLRGSLFNYNRVKEGFEPICITDRSKISLIWISLLEGYYQNFAPGFISDPPMQLPICLSNREETIDYYYYAIDADHPDNVNYYIILEFRDKSIFRMRYATYMYDFYFRSQLFTGKSRIIDMPADERIYFPPVKLRNLLDLLEIRN